MRKAINENPVVQLSVLGVLLVVVGLIFVTKVMKKDEGGEPANVPANAPIGAADAAAGTPAPATGVSSPAASTPAPASAAPTTGSAGTASTATASPASVTPAALVPGPGLPKEMIGAWKSGDALVLLVVRGNGTDDRLVRGSVQALSGDPGLSVFVARAKNIARYSRITQGVGVNRVPALVVVRPKRLSGGVPQAQVSYGFRSSQSVVQTVDDALYSGRDDIPYNPG